MTTDQPGDSIASALAAAKDDLRSSIEQLHQRMLAVEREAVFIERLPLAALLEQAATQEARRTAGESLPLFGLPVAIKDNLDFAGWPTTAGCPAFAYRATRSASVVERLIALGAIIVGKTNLDQFATGLVGVRSPYGVCRSAVNARYVAGGSSSGSALAVAHRVVPIALGTDTAGSGRVPAAFNGIVGLKPTKGLLSTRGIVPACRTLDCVSVFAQSVEDAAQIFDALRGFDAGDPFSRRLPAPLDQAAPCSPASGLRLRVGVPSTLLPFDEPEYEQAYHAAVQRLLRGAHQRVEVDVRSFVQAGALLYGGPWVAERYASVGEFIARSPEQVHPVVRDIILSGKGPSGYELFRGMYTLAWLQREAEHVWDTIDVLALPTTDAIYSVEQVLSNPIETNARLGRYTNFVNLLDLAGLALPAGVTPSGAPFGITLLGRAFSEPTLLGLGKEFMS